MKRYCDKFIEKDLLKKMVFLGGPRQVGKTTLSKQLLTGKWAHGGYLNWDIDEDMYRNSKQVYPLSPRGKWVDLLGVLPA